jgi:hypothetical protein
MGRNILCRGREAPERGIQRKKARRADTLTPDISLIEFNLMFLQQVDVFIFKCLVRVMMHLVCDIRNNPVLLRRADGKRAEPVLPSELPQNFARVIDVFAGAVFQYSYEI